MAGITLASYLNLNQYTIVAQTGITTVNTTTVLNGKYGNAGGDVQITGTFVGTRDNAVGTATTELTTLVNNLATYTAGLVQTTITGGTGPVLFQPNIHYTSAAGNMLFTSAQITFDGQGDPNAKFYITAGAEITFGGTLPTIRVINGACPSNIFWVSGAEITFTDVPNIYGNYIAATQFTSATTTNIFGHIYAQTADVTFSGTTTVNGDLCPAEANVICYAEGTKILTQNGYVNIEDLKAGDKVVSNGVILDTTSSSTPSSTNDHFTLKRIVWASNFEITTQSDVSCPIRITANSLGEGLPFEDLYVSPGHRIVLEGRNIAAKDLVNDTTIVQEYPYTSVRYYHLELEAHYSIVANGILAESYLNTNTRSLFEKSKRVMPKKQLSNWYAAQTA